MTTGSAAMLLAGGIVPVFRGWLANDVDRWADITRVLGGVNVSVQTQDPDADLGPVLSRADAPRLFTMVDSVARRLGLKTDDWTSNLLILDGRVHTELDAFIEITRRFGGLWRLTAALYVLPRPVRDWLYNRIARNRYDWFGKRDVCFVPTPELRSRFLD